MPDGSIVPDALSKASRKTSRMSIAPTAISAAALVLQLDALDQQHRAMDELTAREMSQSEILEFDRLGTQCIALAELIPTCHPETPTDALCVIMAALGQINEVATNNTDPEQTCRVLDRARDAIIRSLVVLAIERDLPMRVIGSRYFFKHGEPGCDA